MAGLQRKIRIKKFVDHWTVQWPLLNLPDKVLEAHYSTFENAAHAALHGFPEVFGTNAWMKRSTNR